MSYKVDKPVNVIKFHKKYYLRMLNGDKTQTMRLARKRLDVKENDIVTAVFPGWEFLTKEGLLNDLKGFYPNMDKFDRLYYYRFELV